MRIIHFLWGAAAIAVPARLFAADQLKFGKAPEWVVQQEIPGPSSLGKDRPVAILLHDQQTQLKPGLITTYSELAFKIQTPEGLGAGNLSTEWNPATDTVTVNKLEIHRGTQIIDVLRSGQTFTTMRRETNLDLAMLDGVLTANIQPEGLREGDVVVMATTLEHTDPVLKGHVEANFAAWNAQIRLAHSRLSWPQNVKLKTQTTSGLPQRRQLTLTGGLKAADMAMRDVEPLIPPKGAPLRFNIGRLGEATDFQSWAEAARLIMPLYQAAAVVPSGGPLREELEKIRTASSDPRRRAELALSLVQDRVRYVALSMGEGGLVPANAETTWARRFGDCKAKTALLLALLHELGIAAEPVAANVERGDAIAGRLPMIGVFNHVLVRAHIAGKEYWLDGTRSGDVDLESIEVPDLGWVLPLTDGASLVHLTPAPRTIPDTDLAMVIDATKGVRAPVNVNVEQTFRGSAAVVFNSGVSSLSDAQRTAFFDEYWTRSYDFLTAGATTTTNFDRAKKTYRISMHGTGKLDWNTGYFHVPNSTVGYAADFHRAFATQEDIPVAVDYPHYAHSRTTIRFPSGFFGTRSTGSLPITRETLAGVEFSMRTTHEIGAAADVLMVETSQHSLVPEVPYKDAVAAEPRLRELAEEDAAIPMPSHYRLTKEDLAAWLTEKPATANAYISRGMSLMDAHEYATGLADFTQALKLEPDNQWALADRALSEVWLRKFDEAEKDLTALDAHSAENPVGLRARGLIAEFRDECAKAVDYYTRSLVKEPENSFAIGHKAMCEASLSKTEEALADSAAALKLDPSWIDLRLLRANIFVRRGNNDLVAKEAELLTSENPQAVYAYVAAGKIYARLARTQDAMKAFDKALAIKADAFVYLNRAQARPFTDQQGRLSDLDAALKIEPKNADALAEKAEQLAAQGDVKGAKGLYDEAVAAAPDVRQYKVRRAVMLFKSGSIAEARAQLAAFRREAVSATDFNSLCWAQATAGVLLDEALEECREALKREPNTAQYLDSLGLVELRLGDLDAAIEDYTRAIGKASLAASYMGRALAYDRKGNQALASADLGRALQLDPDEQTRFADFGLTLARGSSEGAANSETH